MQNINNANTVKSNNDITLGLNAVAKQFYVADALDKMGSDARVLFVSQPGFAKTSIIKSICQSLDYNLTVLLPSNYSADEICGLTALVGEDTVRLMPDWYKILCERAKNGKRNVLFIDELGATYPDVQASLLKVINEKRVSENYHLPSNTLVISACNYGKNYDNGFRMQDATLNRFLIANILTESYPFAQTVRDSIAVSETLRKGGRVFYDYTPPMKKIYDFDKIEGFVLDSGEFAFAPDDATPVENFQYGGLLGCSSVRSMTFAFEYLKTYLDIFQDMDWCKVFGDTLGISPKTDKAYSSVLKINEDDFLFKEQIADINELLGRVKDMLLMKTVDENLLTEVYQVMTNTPNLTSAVRATNNPILSKLFANCADMPIVHDIATLWNSHFNG